MTSISSTLHLHESITVGLSHLYLLTIAFMDITGPRLESYVAVASTQYRPDFSTIPFTAKLKNAVVSLSLPAWDTHRSFEDKVSFEVGKIGSVKAEGSYTFYSTPHPDHQEMLVLHLEVSLPTESTDSRVSVYVSRL